MWRVPLRRDLVDAHRLVLELAEVKEHQLERQLLGSPQRAIGAEADVAVLIVVERLQLRRRLAAGAAIRLARLDLRLLGDVVEVECRDGAAVQGGGENGQRNVRA